eukprot:6211376-Pleurochrysis_carterae.AAC.2
MDSYLAAKSSKKEAPGEITGTGLAERPSKMAKFTQRHSAVIWRQTPAFVCRNQWRTSCTARSAKRQIKKSYKDAVSAGAIHLEDAGMFESLCWSRCASCFCAGEAAEGALVVLPNCVCEHVPALVARLLVALVPAEHTSALWIVPTDNLEEALEFWNTLVLRELA